MANNTRIALFFYLHLVLIAFYSCCVVYPHLGLKIDVLATVLVHYFLPPPQLLAGNYSYRNVVPSAPHQKFLSCLNKNNYISVVAEYYRAHI